MLSFKLICKRHGRVSLLSLSSILSSISISFIPPILFHSLFHSSSSLSNLHCLYTARSASEINHWLLIELDTLRPHSQLTRSELRGHHRGARRRVRRRDHHEELERTKENWSTDRWSSAARRVLADENILNQPDCLRVVSYLRFVRLITRKLLESYSVCESYESLMKVERKSTRSHEIGRSHSEWRYSERTRMHSRWLPCFDLKHLNLWKVTFRSVLSSEYNVSTAAQSHQVSIVARCATDSLATQFNRAVCESNRDPLFRPSIQYERRDYPASKADW